MPVTALSLVVGNVRVSISVASGIPTTVAACPLMVTLVIPAKVNPVLAVSVIDAVYVVSA
jgi:hypothetical protein